MDDQWNTWVEASAFDALSVSLGISMRAAELLLLATGALSVLFILNLWLRYRNVEPWYVAVAHVLVVLVFLSGFMLNESSRGTLDHRCHLYERGQLSMTLYEMTTQQSLHAGALGEPDLVLLVRSERWGADLHTCVISMGHPRAKGLFKRISALLAHGGADRAGLSRGEVTFSFGGALESPNVTFKPYEVSPDKGPPEKWNDA